MNLRAKNGIKMLKDSCSKEVKGYIYEALPPVQCCKKFPNIHLNSGNNGQIFKLPESARKINKNVA